MESAHRKILFYQPRYIWLAAAIVVALLLAAAYLVFDRGKLYAGAELGELRKLRKAQVDTIDKQKRRILSLTEQVAVLQRSSEIDRRASQEVRNDFSELQVELQELRKELDFYRGIMAPGDAKPGLRVQKFEVRPAEQTGSYTVGLTLAQVRHNDRYASGIVELEIEGLEDGRSKVLVFKQIGLGDSTDLTYKFKYFQRLQGAIWMPADFQPLRVKIIVKPKGKGPPASVEEIMDWPA